MKQQHARKKKNQSLLRENALPPYEPQVKMMNYRLRYNLLTDQTLAITWYNLLDSIFVATSATGGSQLFDAVRIRKIEVWWSSQYARTAPPTCSVSFDSLTGGVLGDFKVHSATSVFGEPLHVVAVPAKGSLASLWQTSSNATAFLVQLLQGAIIDVVFDVRMVDTLTPTSIFNVGAGMSLGQVYYRGLDGLRAATTQFQPNGLVNIA